MKVEGGWLNGSDASADGAKVKMEVTPHFRPAARKSTGIMAPRAVSISKYRPSFMGPAPEVGKHGKHSLACSN